MHINRERPIYDNFPRVFSSRLIMAICFRTFSSQVCMIACLYFLDMTRRRGVHFLFHATFTCDVHILIQNYLNNWMRFEDSFRQADIGECKSYQAR